MSMTEKIKNAARDIGGKVKEAAGKATGNPSLEAEGKIDQIEAEAKKCAEEAAEKAKAAEEEAAGRAKSVVGAMTGDKRLEAEGLADRAKASVRDKLNN
jgi:uncharacterized protein YjbJ (UPF0337 family)